jgi:YegS/Rv2252/BmrU family lipid kinase
VPKPFLIVNPRSANGATGRHFDDIASAVREQLGDHDHAFTERMLHATTLARDALRAGAELIIATGGDGTINEVVNGFFEEAQPGVEPKLVRPGAALAVLPRGTGGDFRRTMGLDGDLRKSARHLRGERRPLDVGRVEFLDHDGKPAARYFVNVAGCGVDADIVDIANNSSKMLGGKLSFMIASLRGLAGWSDVSVRATLDDRPPEDLMITSFSVANGKYFGGGMMVAPDARLDDGLFHVTIWSNFGFKTFVLKSGVLYDGSHVKLPGTRIDSAKKIRLEPGPKEGKIGLIELDGEPVGKLPATYTILPGAISLVS